MDDRQFSVVLVTAPSQEQAIAIAQHLLNLKLAACVNLFPVQSLYTWNNTIQTEQEWQLLIKTDLGLFSSLSAEIQQIHPYEVPEIIALPIRAGAFPYLQWLAANLTAQPPSPLPTSQP
jgi:periplasmic divalent cation tolerance protein